MTRVLVVEDELQLVRALEINLKARKYEVHAASDGETALRLAAVCPPDVVLLDLGLPDMDGIDVSVVDLAARRTHQAARLRAESEILSFLAGNVLRGETSLESLLEQVRKIFNMESVALLERESDVDPWTCTGSAGAARPLERPEDADVDMPVGDHMALALSGRVLPAEDRRVLAAFAAQAAVVLDRQRLVGEAEHARELAEGNRIRTALLAAVSHDLRTPLAAIKAAVTSLRSDDVEWSEADQAELLEGIEAGADRLDHLVGNLLDMSRLQTGTVTPLIREIYVDEVVPMALGGVPEDSVVLDIPENLPMVAVDPGLLERTVANIVENAVKYAPEMSPWWYRPARSPIVWKSG